MNSLIDIALWALQSFGDYRVLIASRDADLRRSGIKWMAWAIIAHDHVLTGRRRHVE